MSVVSRLAVARAESRRAARQGIADLVSLDCVTPLDAAQLQRLDALAKAGGVSDAEIDALEPHARAGMAAQTTATAVARQTGQPHFVLNDEGRAAVKRHNDAASAFVGA